jgi:hypothetical protein
MFVYKTWHSFVFIYIYSKKKKWMLLKHTCNDYVQWYFIFLFFF